MDVATILALLVGLVLLVVGGESLVRGAGGLARTMGMSTLVVGLTVVSSATSAPELAVTLGATLSGNPSLAIGNVVGSNVANILLVVGVSAVIMPLAVKSQIVKVDIPIMIALSGAMLLVARDGSIGRSDGAVLFVALIAYVAGTVIIARRRHTRRPMRDVPDGAPNARRPLVDIALIIAGVTLLVAGSQFLVNGATNLAAWLGISDLIIGLTVVAVGTSLPEMATSVIAAVRGDRDLAVGNVVGSNIFNIGAVMGLTGIVAADDVAVADSAIRFDIPIMIAVALVLLPLAFTRFTLSRWEGGLLVAVYGAYVLFLFLTATDQPALDKYGQAMLWFVIPLTAVWLLLLVAYEIGLRRGLQAAGRADRSSNSPE